MADQTRAPVPRHLSTPETWPLLECCEGCLATAAPVREAAMQMRPRNLSPSAGFAGETSRALSSMLLLLGLIGDRRAR
jgi:hypothetical protein